MANVNVYITLKPSLLDAQGKVVLGALENLGYSNVNSLRIGKYIQLDVEGTTEQIKADVDDMCRKLLSNPVIEDYRFQIEGEEKS